VRRDERCEHSFKGRTPLVQSYTFTGCGRHVRRLLSAVILRHVHITLCPNLVHIGTGQLMRCKRCLISVNLPIRRRAEMNLFSRLASVRFVVNRARQLGKATIDKQWPTYSERRAGGRLINDVRQGCIQDFRLGDGLAWFRFIDHTVMAKSLKNPKFETSDLCERHALSIPRRIQQVPRVPKGSQQNTDIVNRLTALNNLNCCVVLCKGF